MTKPKTFAQPSICAACLNDLYSMLLEGQKPGAVHCPHNLALAFITVQSDAVTRWRLIGPIGAAEAQTMFSNVDAARQIALGGANVSH